MTSSKLMESEYQMNIVAFVSCMDPGIHFHGLKASLNIKLFTLSYFLYFLTQYMYKHPQRTHNILKAKDTTIIIVTFCMKLIGFWPAFTSKEQCLRDIALAYTYLMVSYGMVVEINDLYHTWGDYAEFTYILVNNLTIFLIVAKIVITYVYKNDLYSLLIYAERNFWNAHYGVSEQAIMKDYRKICNFFVLVNTITAMFTGIGFTAQPILINWGKNATDRIYAFNMWVEKDWLHRAPYFELIFMSQLLALYHIDLCYFTFDNCLCMLNSQVSSQFRILQYRVAKLSDEKKSETRNDTSDTVQRNYAKGCYLTFKRCVRQHQKLIAYCRMLELVFSKIVLVQVLIFSGLICLQGYQILLSSIPLSRRMTCVFFLCTSMCQLFMFTYSCDGLIQDSTNVGTAIYSAPWMHLPMTKFGRMLRKDLMVMMLKSETPCCLTANGFFPVSLKTYTTVLSTAMSYFTVITQSGGVS